MRANADDADAARGRARLRRAGIGLCRTEHMFFEPSAAAAVRAHDPLDERGEERELLEQLSPLLEAEFEAMFVEMDGLPVTIRLLDPPLHEFLPDARHEAAAVAEAAGRRRRRRSYAAERLAETNPMLGLRGVRLSIVAPVVYEHAGSLDRSSDACAPGPAA